MTVIWEKPIRFQPDYVRYGGSGQQPVISGQVPPVTIHV